MSNSSLSLTCYPFSHILHSHLETLNPSFFSLPPHIKSSNTVSSRSLITLTFSLCHGHSLHLCLVSQLLWQPRVFPLSSPMQSSQFILHIVSQLIFMIINQFLLIPPLSSVQFSCSVVSNSLRLHELQHARPPCPSPTPGVHLNPCPLCQWCHPAISSSVIPFSSCPQFFPASGSFQMSHLHIRWPKYWSFSFNISPSNEHAGLISFRMDWLDLLAVQGTRKSLLQHHSSKASVLQC